MTHLLFACIAVPDGFDSQAPANDPTFGDSARPKTGDPDDPRAPMCRRWNAAHEDLAEAAWTGSENRCDAGDIDTVGRSRALEILNIYRMLAGQPEVSDEAGRNDGAQDCALMMHANESLSHDPPSSWECFSDAGASAAGHSNIATAPAVSAMDMYMQDWGNETTIGHRRWFLSNQLGPVGIGSTNAYSCIYVTDGQGSSSREWVAWPPDGWMPYGAVTAGGYNTLDENGWTVQSDVIDLSGAMVEVREGGRAKAMEVAVLESGYGSTHALKLTPDGWTSEAGATYEVEITGISTPIHYAVEMVDCTQW